MWVGGRSVGEQVSEWAWSIWTDGRGWAYKEWACGIIEDWCGDVLVDGLVVD